MSQQNNLNSYILLQGLAAGTLLYVAFMEIFASEGRHLKFKAVHILTAVLGFALMASVELIGKP